MPDWKNIRRFSGTDEQKRAVAFEAQMLTLLAKDTPAAPVTPPQAVPVSDGIQITVTTNGQTTQYKELAAIPAPVRQQILNAWQLKTALPEARTILPPALPAAQQRSRRLATGLNMFLPGAGQFYLGQRLAGSVFALGFLACCGAVLAIFVRAYSHYLSLSTEGDILQGDNLEQLAHAFPVGVLIGLVVAAIAILIASAIHLRRSRSL